MELELDLKCTVGEFLQVLNRPEDGCLTGALLQGYSWREASRYGTIADGTQATKTRSLRIRIFVALCLGGLVPWCLGES